MNNPDWSPIKPEWKEDCLLLTASKFKDQWEYNSFMIVWINDYWAICELNGEEWGSIDELEADFYKVIKTIGG